MKIKAITQPKTILYPTAVVVIASTVLSGCQQQQQTNEAEHAQYINGLAK